LPPATISRGPRSCFLVSTAAGDDFLKFAAEASKSGLPGPGIAYRSNSSPDSLSVSGGPDTEFGENVTQMRVHRVRGDVKPLGDLTVGRAADN
jgi:hypothetical protein